jgi:hypothetical protein
MATDDSISNTEFEDTARFDDLDSQNLVEYTPHLQIIVCH